MRHGGARIARPWTNGRIERVHRGIERRPCEFEAVSPPASTRPDLSGGHRTASGPSRAEGPRNPICLFVHQHNDERGCMSPDGGGAPARACARKMPQGARRRTGSRESRTGADGRGRASTPSSQEPPTGAGGGALDSRDHAGHRVCCGRGRNRGAQAQMTTGCARTGVQCLKANFLRGCDGQGRPRPQEWTGQGPG